MKTATYLIRQILDEGYALPTRCIPADVVAELSEYYGETLDFQKINTEMCYILNEEDD